MDDVVEELVRRRKAAGIAQQEVARRARLSLMTIGRIERGESSPKLPALQAYAGAVGIRLEWRLEPSPVSPARSEVLRAVKALAEEQGVERDTYQAGVRCLEAVLDTFFESNI